MNRAAKVGNARSQDQKTYRINEKIQKLNKNKTKHSKTVKAHFSQKRDCI